MFFLLDALLWGGLLAGLLKVATALAGPAAGRAQRWQAVWAQEWMPFGEWGRQARLEAGNWLFLGAVVVFQWQAVVSNSLARELFSEGGQNLVAVLDGLVFCMLGAKTLLCTKVSFKQYLCAGAVFFVLRWVFLNAQHFWFGAALCMALAAKDVPLRRVLKACFAVTAGGVALVNLLAVTGVIPTLVEPAGARPRYSFGYGWYNLLGAYVLGAALMYMCLRQKRFRWYDFALLLALAAYMNYGPDSRASTLCLLLLAAMLLAVRLWPGLFGKAWLRWVLAAAPFLAWGVSYWLQRAYDPEMPLFAKLNSLFSGRLGLGHEAIDLAPVRLLGRQVTENVVVDNFYLQWWLNGGPVASLLLWLGFAILIFRLLKNSHPTEAVCCLVMLAHGVMESHVVWPCVNITIWLLAGVVYLLPDERFPSFAPGPAQKERIKV